MILFSPTTSDADLMHAHNLLDSSHQLQPRPPSELLWCLVCLLPIRKGLSYSFYLDQVPYVRITESSVASAFIK